MKMSKNQAEDYHEPFATAIRKAGFEKHCEDRRGGKVITEYCSGPVKLVYTTRMVMNRNNDSFIDHAFEFIVGDRSVLDIRRSNADWGSIYSIVHALANPEMLPTCLGMGFDEVIGAYFKEMK